MMIQDHRSRPMSNPTAGSSNRPITDLCAQTRVTENGSDPTENSTDIGRSHVTTVDTNIVVLTISGPSGEFGKYPIRNIIIYKISNTPRNTHYNT